MLLPYFSSRQDDLIEAIIKQKAGGLIIATATKSTVIKSPPAAKPVMGRDARQAAIDIARLALASRCHSVNVLDVREVSGFTDYMIIATGTSDRQMKGIAHEIEAEVAADGHHTISRSMGDQWVLLDFVDFVVHLFADDARQYYDLDSLWGDAKKVEWKEKK